MDEIDKLRQNILKSDTFCFYPFLEMSTRPNSAVFPCCYWNEQDSIMDNVLLSSNSISEVWNNKKFKKIRMSLSNNVKLIGCSTCARDKSASMRTRSIKEYINNEDVLERVLDTINNNGYSNYSPYRFELKPSNLCNLKCLMCNSFDSSQIEKELISLSKNKGVETKGGTFLKFVDKEGIWEGEFKLPIISDMDKWSETEEFFEEIKLLLPYIKVLSFAGGEPTLSPVINNIIQYAVDNEFSKNITVYISCNFTNFNSSFFENMSKFKKFELIASIDGIESVQEYIRFPSKWKVIKQNLLKAKKFMNHENVKILLNITVNILNIFSLHKLLEFIDDLFDIRPYFYEWPYNINLLSFPEFLQISHIPIEYRQDIIDNLQKYLNTSKVISFFPELSSKIKLLISELSKEFDVLKSTHQLSILLTYLSELDKNRQNSYSDVIPELSFIFDKYIKKQRYEK